jgi:Spy/CpxP family protein refolding chaperone
VFPFEGGIAMATPRCLLLAGVVLLLGLVGLAQADNPAKLPVVEYFYLPSHPTLTTKDVQKEIGLTEEQIQKLREISKGFQMQQPPRLDMSKMTEEERKKALEEYNKKSQEWMAGYKTRIEEAGKKVEAVLTAEQKNKLEIIDLRQFGGSMLLFGTMGEKLELTDQQKEQLSKEKDKFQKKQMELTQQFQKNQQQANQAALAILTPEQIEQLKKLVKEVRSGGGMPIPRKN